MNILTEWEALKARVKRRACELIRTGEFNQGTPVRELLVRAIADVTGTSVADIRRQVDALPGFVVAPLEAELTLLYQRCAQVVPPPEPAPAPEESSSTGSGLKVAGGVALAAFLVWLATRKTRKGA